MSSETEQFRKRLRELADHAWNGSRYCFTDFLNEAEFSDVLSLCGQAADAVSSGEETAVSAFPAGITAYGGHSDASRVMIRFGSEETTGYTEPFPIVIVKISPLLEKFSDTFSHRDYLGAILNLGIERRVTGDILTDGTHGYLFCEEKIAEFICENLTQVRHTHVRSEITDSLPGSLCTTYTPVTLQLSSERLDAVIAKLYHFSRSTAIDAFRGQKVYVNGRLCENQSYTPKENDKISVRGFGKFRYLGMSHITKKGKCSVTVEKFE
ncbi:MAG: YlmH/Sll1252 family protein [Lachnospiraceae bacterium]|nr:YlmH/Sll1252 family protein [Lachnospiraceae bacterium]